MSVVSFHPFRLSELTSCLISSLLVFALLSLPFKPADLDYICLHSLTVTHCIICMLSATQITISIFKCSVFSVSLSGMASFLYRERRDLLGVRHFYLTRAKSNCFFSIWKIELHIIFLSLDCWLYSKHREKVVLPIPIQFGQNKRKSYLLINMWEIFMKSPQH